MLKEYAAVLRHLSMFTDMMIVLLTYTGGLLYVGPPAGTVDQIVYCAVIIMVLWGLLLNHFGMYLSFRMRDMSEVMAIILKSAVLGYLIFAGLMALLPIPAIEQSYLSWVFLVSGWALCFEKILLIIFLKMVRAKGYNYRSILIVGTGPRAQKFIERVHAHKEWGLRILGLVDNDWTKKNQVVHRYPVIGTLEDIPRILQENVVDEVAFVLPRKWLDQIEESIHYCESQGIKVHIALDIFNLRLSRIKQTDFDGLPLLTFETTPDKIWLLLLKRLFDVVVSLLGLILLFPMFFTVALLIKASSPGPILFRQKRAGLNGRRFTLLKFRTMVQGAEGNLEGLKEFNEMKGPAFKMKNDPRVTPVGKILREFSIDEFPQLWNVLVGDMSIVGPRPPLPSELEQFKPWQRRKLSMRPGITCLWQAGGRNKIDDFNEWMKLDLQYIDHWSPWLDFKLLLKTIPAVLFRVGAK